MTGEDGVKSEVDAWLELAERYRVADFRGREVVQAWLRPGLGRDSPPVRRLLDSWAGSSYVHEGPDGVEIVLVSPSRDGAPTRWWLHLVLAALTLFTTHMAGALMRGWDPLRSRPVELLGVVLPLPTAVDWEVLALGSPFALSFLGILLAHEMGHYVTARLHRVDVTPPFFLPFPAYWSVVGTLGAFIRIKGPTVRRSILFDIGAGGPLASFVVSIPVFAVGLGMSRVATTGSVEAITPFAVPFLGQAIWLGDGAVVHALAFLEFGSALGSFPIVLHPVAFAGWLGFFVTALNLLPMGQLDGGHILYTLSGRLQSGLGRLFLLSLLPLGLLWWGWWLWAVVAFAINRGRMVHPPVLQEGVPLDRARRILGWVCIAIFVLTFVPVPLAL